MGTSVGQGRGMGRRSKIILAKNPTIRRMRGVFGSDPSRVAKMQQGCAIRIRDPDAAV